VSFAAARDGDARLVTRICARVLPWGLVTMRARASRRSAPLPNDRSGTYSHRSRDMRGLRVLNVGCGDREFAAELARRGAIVMGVDASAVMIDAARALARSQNVDIEFQVARAEQLPLPDRWGTRRPYFCWPAFGGRRTCWILRPGQPENGHWPGADAASSSGEWKTMPDIGSTNAT
jgi:SAM-dependent methyltransferase